MGHFLALYIEEILLVPVVKANEFSIHGFNLKMDNTSEFKLKGTII